MAVIWADFPSGQTGLYGTDRNFMLNGIWAGLEGADANFAQIVNDPDPSIGASGRVFRTRNFNLNLAGARFALPAGPTQTIGTSARLWLSELPGANWNGSAGPLIEFRTSGNVVIAALTVLANGAIAAATNSGGSSLFGTTTGPAVVANAYNHIEVKLSRSSGAGTIEVRVNGVVVLNLSSLNLGTIDPAIIFYGSNTRSVSGVPDCISYWKDIIFWDTTTAQNNDFLGECIVRHLIPDGDVTLGGWTTSSGSTGFNLLAQSPPVDTNFISADDTPPAAASFTLTNLPPDIVTVKALLPITRSRKVDGGDGNLQTGLTGTLTDLGADKPITSAFTYRWDVSELSPDTGTPWTPVEVDAVKLDIDRTI